MTNDRIVYSYDAFARRLEWTFGDGSTVYYTIPHDEFLEPICNAALIHGFKQKIADAAAIARNPETGKSATMADKRAAMQKVVDQLNDGMWNAERTGGTGNVGGLLAVAIAAVKGLPIERVREFLKGKTKAQREAMALVSPYREKIAELIAARTKDVDTNEMEDELNDL